MPAFVKSFKLFDVSVNYDGITFYPKCDLGKKASLSAAINKSKKRLVEKLEVTLTFDQETPEGIKFKRARDTWGTYQEIHDDDEDDHDFYHKDSLNSQNKHIHIKFPSMLTREKLETLLSIFVTNELFTAAEKKEFLDDYDDRIESARCDLHNKLKTLVLKQGVDNEKEKEKLIVENTQTIINHIKECKDNEILVELHRYLSIDRYDYLRRTTQKTTWQGTDKKGNVVNTREEWALIEKNIAFQMAHNVKENVSHFTSNLANERAKQLSQHAFFAIKRKQNVPGPSKMFAAFSSGDEKEFEARYQKQSTRIRR